MTCQTPDVPVSSVAVSGSGVSNGVLSLVKGKSAQLTASVSPSNATNKTVTWSSSNAAIATVTGTGYVSAVKAGTATVTASAGGKSASVRVTVTDPSSSQRFSDVPSGAWYASSVDWAASNGVVSGYGDGRFGPADSVSRAQMVALLYNLAVKEGDAKAVSYKTPKSSSFSDVPVSAWYAKQVSWAAAYGVVSGYGNGRFGPADMVSRGQAAAMLRNFARYRGVSGSSASASFSDVPSGAWYASSVSWVVSNGVASGYGNGKFGPSDVASRAQAVAMLQKLDKLTASPSSSLSISGDGVSDGKLSLAKGSTVQLSAVNVPSGASTVTWWSDDDAVAVTGTGLVIGVKAGSGVVHVQAGGKSAVLTVTVK
ncbi:S-layer homology domain-containing protein [uncultured Bifidobacterium sp.]|uniref:S-layer homology domain-containing protein n=1 Tax=uncultured Bifidobacterium sp. TaxID=165187 RepID=UPI00338DB644